MDHQEYSDLTQQANAAFEEGRAQEAVQIFHRLISSATLPQVDRSVMAVNLATVLQKSGADARQVEAAYDQGIALEQRVYRSFVREHKASWLDESGRPGEAAMIYRQLLAEHWPSSSERLRFQHNLTLVTGP
ncbi:hypothetical protein [Pseudactinotalea sp. Z1732]|uniref:hypothetical protein n=1 Tax=Micrococcales TaxID=85006 RepID=UPI003C79BA51